MKTEFPNLKKWWEYEPDKIMSFVYWTKRQIPPTEKHKKLNAWFDLKKQLEEQYPKTK